jgi:hypothetical protein
MPLERICDETIFFLAFWYLGESASGWALSCIGKTVRMKKGRSIFFIAALMICRSNLYQNG